MQVTHDQFDSVGILQLDLHTWSVCGLAGRGGSYNNNWAAWKAGRIHR